MRKNSTTTAAACRNCRYYTPRAPRGGRHCRRLPPIVTPDTAGDKCFPIVNADDWCGSSEATNG